MFRTVLLFLTLMGAANVALSQTPLLKNASLLELESILAEYGDVETERVQLDLEQGTVVILEISYSALPQTVLTAYASEGPIMLFGYFSEQDIDPRRFLLSDEARGQNSWIFEVDDDGDLGYKAFLTPETREEMEELAIALMVLLQLTVEPHLYNEAAPVVEVADALDIAACIESVSAPMASLPMKMRQEFQPEAFCLCIADRATEDPSLITAMLNPTSDEGQALMRSCWESYLPRWQELGVTFDAMMAEVNGDEVNRNLRRNWVRNCVEAMVAEPEWANSDIGYGQAEGYCGCLFDEMANREDLSLADFEDLNSDAMVELQASCIDELGLGSPAGWNAGQLAQGCAGEQKLPLLWNGSGYQIRLTLGATIKYILLDSGASEVIIDKRWYEDLRAEGSIRPGDYQGVEYLEIADGSVATIERYRVSSLTIGDCVFRDFSIGVMEEGGMMCGMGLLGLFETWTLDTRNSQLILRN